MEILSPAGNTCALIAAVRSGADAVYLGLKDFSARRNAENFDRNQFAAAVKYCHTRSVKVYVALNTMMKENELAAAIDEISFAYSCGADAFIVSDLGLIYALKTILPEAVLHASTQMTVHSPSAIKPLKKLGIKRIVLAREMSREQIKEFCEVAKKENIEVEVFVHGALCMCVSGQCLLSSVLGGRSGNRGLCAGPCRLEFSAKGQGRYDLSLKDLSLLAYLKELESFGVASAKIEGRMKRPEYVAAATAACRAALDGRTDKNLEAALKSVFSRSGFTDGYYTSRLGAGMFGIRTKEDVSESSDTFAFLHSLYKNERQSVGLNITAKIKQGKNLTLTVNDVFNNSVTLTGDIPQSAKSKATNESTIKSALSKLGGTPYYADKIRIDLDDDIYVSLSELNKLRREAVSILSEKRAYIHKKKKAVYKTPKHIGKSYGHKVYARFLSARQVPKDISGIDAVILPAECDFTLIPDSVLKIADLPRYIINEEDIENQLNTLKSRNVNCVYCQSLAAITLSKNAGFNVIASNGLNCANTQSAAALSGLGADMAVLSAELNIEDAKHLECDIKKGIFAYGRLPLMLTRNCPIKNAKTCKECEKKGMLRDRKGISFPVVCRNGYSEILNSAPIYLGDKGDDLNYFDFLLFNFTDERQEDVQKILDDYASSQSADFTFTRGLYYKNLP